MKNKVEDTSQFAQPYAKAIGNDLVYLPTFKESFNDLFKRKAYTASEIDYCEQYADAILHFASTWAAKEAVYKCIKQLESLPISFRQIEISRDKLAGRPSVAVPEKIEHKNFLLTISHDGDYVWALALVPHSEI